MKFVCLMGATGSGKSTVEHLLEVRGCTRSVSYTTREPQVRNGKLEEDGKEYRFVTREKFLDLVDRGIIIEYEEYAGNMYGTPEPFGASEYVAVVCTNGFKALKEKYGKQIIGVYLSCNEDTAVQRSIDRGFDFDKVKQRIDRDRDAVDEMQRIADYTIDTTDVEPEAIADAIMQTIFKNRKE